MSWLSDHINLLGLIGAIVILLLTIAIAYFYIKKMKTETAGGEFTTHEWDGIREFSNDVPKGWLLSLVLVTIWGVWYILFGYPLNSFSQIGQYNEETESYNKKFDAVYANLSQEQLRQMGEEIFLVQCSQCHGLTAEGIDGKAQDLTRWGKVDGIIDTVKHGSMGLKNEHGEEYGEMPGELVTEDRDIVAVAHYVMKEIVGDTSMSYDNELVAKGSEVFSEFGCNGCHGDKGEGVDGVGPALVNYGKKEFLANVLKGKKGNIGIMPSFEYLNLSNKEIEALEAFISSKHKIQ